MEQNIKCSLCEDKDETVNYIRKCSKQKDPKPFGMTG